MQSPPHVIQVAGETSGDNYVAIDNQIAHVDLFRQLNLSRDPTALIFSYYKGGAEGIVDDNQGLGTKSTELATC